MKFSDLFEQNPAYTFEQNLGKTHFNEKILSQRDLESKGQGHSKSIWRNMLT